MNAIETYGVMRMSGKPLSKAQGEFEKSFLDVKRLMEEVKICVDSWQKA